MKEVKKLRKENIITVVLIILLAACAIAFALHTIGLNKQSENPTETTTETTTEANDDEPTVPETPKEPEVVAGEKLIAEYRAGTWDGGYRRVNGKVYHITKYGYLVANNDEDAESDGGYLCGYPDVPNNIQIARLWYSSVRMDKSTLETGTVVIDSNLTELFYCVRGKEISSHKLSGKLANVVEDVEDARLIGFGDCVAVSVGQHLCIYNIAKNWENRDIDNAVDVINDSHGLLISTMDRVNYSVDGSGKFTQLNSHYVKFPTEDMDLACIPKVDQKTVSAKGRSLFAGIWDPSRDHYYLYANNDQKTYSVYYDDGTIIRPVAKDVVDAETVIGGCYFITSDGKVYYDDAESGKKSEVYSGTANALVYAVTEEVYIVTSESEANVFAVEGWDYLYNPNKKR